MNLTSQQLEALKGKCPECNGDGYHFEVINGARVTNNLDCPRCQGTGQATIEIDKEYEDGYEHLPPRYRKPKYKVGDEIYIWHSTLKDVILSKQEYELMLSALDKDEKRETKEETDILKIISETETKQYVQMV